MRFRKWPVARWKSWLSHRRGKRLPKLGGDETHRLHCLLEMETEHSMHENSIKQISCLWLTALEWKGRDRRLVTRKYHTAWLRAWIVLQIPSQPAGFTDRFVYQIHYCVWECWLLNHFTTPSSGTEPGALCRAPRKSQDGQEGVGSTPHFSPGPKATAAPSPWGEKGRPMSLPWNADNKALSSLRPCKQCYFYPTWCRRLNSSQCLQKVWGYLDVLEYLNANYYKIKLWEE